MTSAAGADPRTGPRNLTYRIVLVAVLAMAYARPASSQAPGRLTGTVRDEAGRPLRDALVILDPAPRSPQVTTDSSGRFRFDRVRRGSHTVRVLRVGYQGGDRTVDLPEEGLDITVVLPRITVLDTLPIRARRTGIFGTVIARTGFRPLQGATVDVIGAHRTAHSDSTGRFNLPDVHEGAYVIRVQRDRYASRLLSVPVPHDSAVELAVVMDDAGGTSLDKSLAQPLHEFDERMRSMRGNAAVIPRQEIAAARKQTVDFALQFSPSFMKTGLVFDEAITCVYVDGIFRPMVSPSDFSADEVEAIEVYGLRSDYTNTLDQRRPPNLPCGNPSARPKHVVDGGTSGVASGLQPGGRSGRVPMDNVARAIVIWLKHGR